MSIWRHLFRKKVETDATAKAEATLTTVVEANKAAREAVATELEKVLRGIAGDLTDAADKIGGGKHDGR